MVGVKSELLQDMRKHRCNWDADYENMAADRKWRALAKPLLSEPWQPNSADSEPPEHLVVLIEEKLRQKIKLMEYIEAHDADLGYGPGAAEWPEHHKDAIMELAARWCELHQQENRPAHRGIAAMVSEARAIFEDENDQEKASEAHIRRYVKTCGFFDQ